MSKNKKRVTIINQDSGYLMIDTANAFVDAGYEVSLITGRLVKRNKTLKTEVTVQYITPYIRTSILKRFYSWIIGFAKIVWIVRRKHSKSHLFIVSNPPIAPFIPFFCKNSYSLLIYDVYIEKLEEFTLLGKKSPLVYFWKKAHKKSLKEADSIFTLTDGMKEQLKKYSSGKQISVVPVWTDNDFLKPIEPAENPFVIDHKLKDKFIVLYSGNIGASSGVENIVEFAKNIKCDRIIFLIIGDGLNKKIVEAKVREYKINNCVLLPWQSTDILPYSLAAANLSIVSLINKSDNTSIPSKLFNYISVGSPILCLASEKSDLAKVVLKEKIGCVFQPDEIDKIVTYITKLSEDRSMAIKYS